MEWEFAMNADNFVVVVLKLSRYFFKRWDAVHVRLDKDLSQTTTLGNTPNGT